MLVNVTVTINVDYDQGETSWEIKDALDDKIIDSINPSTYRERCKEYVNIIELIYGRSYVFTIRDTFGDGMSKVCAAGYSLSVTKTNETLFAGDGFSFTSMRSYAFSIERPPSSQPSSTSASNEPIPFPSMEPTEELSLHPSTSMQSSRSPSMSPSIKKSFPPSLRPSSNRSTSPSLIFSPSPSSYPSSYPSNLSMMPSKIPSTSPTETKSQHPSLRKTLSPSQESSSFPSVNSSLYPSSVPSQPPSLHELKEIPYTLILRFDQNPQDISWKLGESFPQSVHTNIYYGEQFGHYTIPCDHVKIQLYLLEGLTYTFSIYDKEGNGMNAQCNNRTNSVSEYGYSLYEGSIDNLGLLILEGDGSSFTFVKQETFVEASIYKERSSVPSQIPTYAPSTFPSFSKFPMDTNIPSSLPSIETSNLPSASTEHYETNRLVAVASISGMALAGSLVSVFCFILFKMFTMRQRGRPIRSEIKV